MNTTPNGNQVYFALGRTEITSRLVEGQLPNDQGIIPTEAKSRVKFLTTEFRRATAAAVFAPITRTSSAWSAAPPAKPRPCPGLGPGEEHQRRDRLQRRQPRRRRPQGRHSDRRQRRYLRGALEAIDIRDVLLQITSPSNRGIIKPAGEPNRYSHEIMPMHVAR